MSSLITASAVRDCASLRRFDVAPEGDLELWSYTECSDASPELVKRSRGIVLSGDRIVSRTFGYTKELLYSSNLPTDHIRQLFQENPVPQCSFYVCMEGSTVRLFHHNDKWYLSTFRKLDAHASRWQSKHSFGELFNIALKELYMRNVPFAQWVGTCDDLFAAFTDKLDKARTHTFIMPSTKETRQIVSGLPFQTLIYTGSFDPATGAYSRMEDTPLPLPLFNGPFATEEEVFSNLETIERGIEAGLQGRGDVQCQGLMVVLPTGCLVKIACANYQALTDIRGNTPSGTARYTDVLATPVLRDGMRRLYPERAAEFDTIEANLKTACKFIHRTYMLRHIEKQQLFVHPMINYIDKALHGNYLQTRAKVTPAVVDQYVMAQPPRILHQLSQLVATNTIHL